MVRKRRHNASSDSADYMRGYADGMKGAFEESELDAYYAGVGYAKKNKGVKNIGFSSPEERASFEHGMSSEAKHFSAPRYEPLTFIERLLGKRERVKKAKRSKRAYVDSQSYTKRMQKKHSTYKRKMNKKKRR